ncbi:metal-dependent transcriptional regulator [Actinomyces culturomici]|uniref:metal-dependent transcriptional regulator n=1 Tax=Actinomyces culturomici TaxID=1926276 RepID=UPI000E2037DD|nr:metal-dependent transcriptional regulator [Actinomyces culturomici]
MPRGSRATNGDAGRGRVAEDYLKAMWSDEESGGDGISVNDLAARMGVVASTASENVARLTAQGLVTHEPYKRVHFTPEGRAVAVGMVRRHRLLETYLHDRLGFDWDEVHEEAEILEHAVSDRLLAHIDDALGRPARDPHGDPIPDADGAVRARPMRPLLDFPAGEWGRVARLSDSDPQTLRDLAAAGIALDALVRLVAGPIDGAGAPCNEVALELAEPGTPVSEVDASAQRIVLASSTAAAVKASPIA